MADTLPQAVSPRCHFSMDQVEEWVTMLLNVGTVGLQHDAYKSLECHWHPVQPKQEKPFLPVATLGSEGHFVLHVLARTVLVRPLFSRS